MFFSVLGPVTVRTADGRPVEIPEVKVRALLADLLAHRRRPVPAHVLIDDLWAEQPPANPTGALQTKVSRLRQALGSLDAAGRDVVRSRKPGYVLDAAPDSVDADVFTSLAGQARRAESPADRARLLTDALALWRGAAYGEFADEPFARAEVLRLEEDRLVAVEDLAQARLDLGEHAELAARLGDLADGHPLRERLQAIHMTALYRAGRQSEALARFDAVRRTLRDDYGLDPGERLVALQQAVLRHDPALDPAPAGPRTNLPVPTTELIGRERAAATARSLLRTARLVTLTGPGGVGKTRLAVEVAAGLVDEHPDGAWLVELAAVPPGSAAETVAGTVMAVLALRDAPEAGPVEDRLADALRARRTLLVLDNCEHVVAGVARLAERLLAAAPGVRLLATSQEPLGLSAEVISVVPPLDLPDPADAPADVERSGAVRLFVARAAPSFRLDAENARAVAVLCRGLDGLPLALELAATRVRTLGVHELATRLDDRFRLLAGGYRDAPPRQRTLRAMIDWSWELLAPAERAVLRRLAVHSDGCTVDGAEAVCAGGDVAAQDVLDIVARLVDRSLVTVVDGPDGVRYRLLESVADYCRDRLAEAGEDDRARDAHLEFHTRLAESAETRLRGPEQGRWLARLDAESANLRAALDRAVGRCDAAGALRLVNALSWYWYLRGRLTDARRALSESLALPHGPAVARARATAFLCGVEFLCGEVADRAAAASAALAAFDAVDDPRGRARAQLFLGLVESDYGALAASEDLVSRAQRAAEELGDRWGVAAALGIQALRAHTRGDLDAIRRNGERSLALFRELGDRWGRLRATEALGGLAEIEGDYEQAARLHRDGLRIAEELRLWPQAADRLSWLGRISMLRGDHVGARELNERALRLSREQSYQPGQLFARINLGMIARREGALDVAEDHLRAALEHDWEPGIGLWLILTELGFTAEQRGDAAVARSRHLEGLTVARALNDRRAAATALEGLAGACLAEGVPAEAARLLGAATAARRAAGAVPPAAERGDRDRIEAAVRAAVGEDAFAAEFARGLSDGTTAVPIATGSAG